MNDDTFGKDRIEDEVIICCPFSDGLSFTILNSVEKFVALQFHFKNVTELDRRYASAPGHLKSE
jgi:hypothetical protein